MFKKFVTDYLFLPLVGVAVIGGIWVFASSITRNEETGKVTLPGPVQTWEESKLYLLEPLADRGPNDQGILIMTWISLSRVLQGFGIALLLGVPVGFLLGSSKTFAKVFDPVIQVLRPVSPLAWFPIGQAVFLGLQQTYEVNVGEAAAVFTVAVCAMWPTVLNTAAGVRAIPQDYHNVAKVLKLSKTKTLFKILFPAAMPHMFTGFRLSLGMAWLVIVAAEMLTGKNGIGGFLNQEFYASRTEHIFLCIIAIGLVGFVLDRLMSLVEANVMSIAAIPGAIRRWVVSIRPAPAVAAEPAV
jgi:nitrate/nitrite transport system permease protein